MAMSKRQEGSQRGPAVSIHGYLHAQTSQNFDHLRIRHADADHLVELGATQLDGGSLGQMGIGFDFDDRTRFTTADVQQQTGGTIHHLGLQLGSTRARSGGKNRYADRRHGHGR